MDEPTTDDRLADALAAAPQDIKVKVLEGLLAEAKDDGTAARRAADIRHFEEIELGARVAAEAKYRAGGALIERFAAGILQLGELAEQILALSADAEGSRATAFHARLKLRELDRAPATGVTTTADLDAAPPPGRVWPALPAVDREHVTEEIWARLAAGPRAPRVLLEDVQRLLWIR